MPPGNQVTKASWCDSERTTLARDVGVDRSVAEDVLTRLSRLRLLSAAQ